MLSRLLAVVALHFLLTAPALAQVHPAPQAPPLYPSTVIPTGEVTRTTPAGRTYCALFPSDCAFDRREPEVLEMTWALWALVNRVNREVNRDIRPITDLDHFGVADVWTFPEDGMGDCEDYQMEKRRRLIAAGIPRRPLKLTMVFDAEQNGHMVLLLRTVQGDYVLDNLETNVMPWRQTGYEFLKREGDVAGEWLVLIPGNPTASNPSGKPRGGDPATQKPN